MARAFLVVMDSVGIGGALDAGAFFNGDLPDLGTNTVAHIAQACAKGHANEGRSGPLKLPNLVGLGLGAALRAASSIPAPGLDGGAHGLWGCGNEESAGKDTPTGHWELAGVRVPWRWHVFPDQTPAFDIDLMQAVADLAATNGTLANCHGSGTDMLDRFGEEHMKTGWPICYTSADSVFQIAAHEERFGLKRLLDLCTAIAPRLHDLRVGRVIARPFVGSVEAGFQRTNNRRDYAVKPPAPTLLDWVQSAGGTVHAIGKIGDIFSQQGIDTVDKGSDAELMQHLLQRVETAAPGSLTFANFVEFDSLYGHRRDIAGYARALEWIDNALGRLLSALQPDDILIVTADHGNDPSWPGTDHTRERVPILVAGAGTGPIGQRRFVDVAASIAQHLRVDAPTIGKSFL
ncbi:phosphopentomutase [Epibacterium sp. SM1969]|uniref:Phosphopentomutase n=1 Tax=Tritonibacter aquimaris TaxID=2663379 RepID=A0A844B0P0_9RHOB|nr:phosphopentomutase [Tritonibacter aquimaris]MQY42966.1 phosphopentomutase [Tritonibacter aquimaris]